MDKLQEALAKHRKVKDMMLTLLEKVEGPNLSKAKIKAELFRIYLELK